MKGTAFGELKSTVPEILGVEVRKNCVSREGNYDLMIRLELKDRESLATYLRHSLHVKFVETMSADVDSKVSFDYED